MVRETTRGTATALRVASTSRRVVLDDEPETVTRFCLASLWSADSAISSVIPGLKECRISSVTFERVVGLLHASQAAPAVAFNAKTLSFLESTITFDPSGS